MQNFFFKTVRKFFDFNILFFIITALIFGTIMLLFTPFDQVPDEAKHYYRACEIADGKIINKSPVQYTKYDDVIRVSSVCKRYTEEFNSISSYNPVMYVFTVLTLKTGYILSGEHFIPLLLLRFINLLAYIIICVAAIKITPVFKYPFIFVMLFPMSIYEAASVSADMFYNAFSFLFFAFVFKLIFDDKKLVPKDYILLLILTLAASTMKGLGMFYPLLLLFCIPKEKCDKRLVLALLFISFFVTGLWINITPKFSRSVAIADSLIFLKAPFYVLDKMVFTTKFMYYHYISSCISRLGNYAILFPTKYINVMLVSFFSLFIFIREKVSVKLRIASLAIFLMYYIELLYIELVVWTDINSPYIEGTQGRHFLALLPLLFLVFAFSGKILSTGNNFFKKLNQIIISEKCQSLYFALIRTIQVCILCLSLYQLIYVYYL